MNPEFETTKKALKFTLAKQMLQRLLDQQLISESEFQTGVELLAERFKVDARTGSARAYIPKENVEKQHEEPRVNYISLTEWAKQEADKPATVIITWLHSHNTLEFLREWEKENNPKFNEAGYRELIMSKSKTVTPKMRCEMTGAIGIMSRVGNQGGTYAEPVIAYDFKMWHNTSLRYILMDGLVNGAIGGKSKKSEKPLPEKKIHYIPPKKMD